MMNINLIVIGSIIVLAFLGAWRWGEGRYQDGQNAMRVELMQQYKKQIDIASRDYEIELEKSRLRERKAMKLIADLQSINNEPEIITKEIIKYVEKTDCKRLGDDFKRLFNHIHANAQDGNSNEN